MTLTELNYYVRRFAPFVLIGGIVIITLIMGVRSYFMYLDSKKPKSLLIEPIFGKIPRPSFKKTYPYLADAQFILDTIEGVPETATDTARVFFLPPKTTRFGYLQKIYLMAKTLGFNTDLARHKIKNQQAIFEDDEKKFTVHITDFNFEFERKDQNHAGFFDGAQINDIDRLRQATQQLFTTLGRYPDELFSRGRENFLYFNVDPETHTLVPVEKEKGATVLEIDFFRPDIDGFPTVSPTYFTSTNFALVTEKNGVFTLVKSRVQFFEKEDQKVGIYPVKPGNTAWEELQNGKGLIVSEGENASTTVIKKMFLAYLDPDEYASYLQPLYVFFGEDGFVGYVPALTDEFVE